MSDLGPARRRGISAGAVVRVVLAVGLITYLFWVSDPRAVAGAMHGADWRPMLVVVLLVLADRALMAHRWLALLRPLRGERLPSRAFILKIFFVSTFVGTFLPASIGGDAARSYALARGGVPMGDALASVFVDRMLGVLSLLIVACAGLLLAWDLASMRAVVIGLAFAGTACVAAAAVIFCSSGEAFVQSIVARVPSKQVRSSAENVVASLRRYAHHRGALIGVLGSSLLVQVLRILQAVLLGIAIGMGAPPTAYFAFVPLIMLVMLLPITINGLGTSQAAFMWFFSRTGTPAHEAFALSVLFVGLQIIGNIPGAVLVLTGKVK